MGRGRRGRVTRETAHTGGDGAAPRGSYPKGRMRRQQVVEEALEVFSRLGYRGVSMRDIAKRTGLTPPGLRHHFPDKDALFAAVLHERDERVRAAAGDPQEHTFIEQAKQVVAHNQAFRGLASLYAIVSAEASEPSHPLHDEFVDRYRTNATRTGALVRAGQQAGKLREDLDPEMAARLISAVMDGIQLQWLLDESVDMVPLFEGFVHGYLRPAVDNHDDHDNRE